MTVTFEPFNDDGYFVIKCTGKCTDDELYTSIRDFLHSDLWVPGMNTLSDLSEANLEDVTAAGVRNISKMTNERLHEFGIENTKKAIFAPENLPFGLSRIYSAASEQQPEWAQVYRSLEDAREFLMLKKEAVLAPREAGDLRESET